MKKTKVSFEKFEDELFDVIKSRKDELTNEDCDSFVQSLVELSKDPAYVTLSKRERDAIVKRRVRGILYRHRQFQMKKKNSKKQAKKSKARATNKKKSMSPVARLVKQGYDKEIFDTENEALAFVDGIERGRDQYSSTFDCEIFPPKKPEEKWSVCYKVEHRGERTWE